MRFDRPLVTIAISCCVSACAPEVIGVSDGDSETGTGDGDGDSGDGDGDPGDGDGDPGDGDPGDGDPGDGDPGDGDGDGDPMCGNAVVDPGEQCDVGSETMFCDADCTYAMCGDGYQNMQSEQCDDGNELNTDGCVGACTIAACGDGFVQMGMEECDDGDMDDGNDCRNDCALPYCGDGLIWADGNGEEECDDANMSDDDACTTTCTASFCGDGVLWQGMETCDDGNLLNNDACPGSCEPAFCGDGYKWNGMEECDDGDQDDEDGCSNSCIGSSGAYVFLTSSNGDPGFHRYSIDDDAWETMTSPPSETYTQITNDGVYVYSMGSNNTIYEYDVAQDEWSDLMAGPDNNLTGQPIGFFQWFPDGFYYLKDGDATMYVHRNGQWSSFALGSSGSCAGTYDDDNQELYIRTYGELGFTVVDTTNDTVARTIADASGVGENSRTGSYSGGFFYSRDWSDPFQRFDGVSGNKTTMMGTPTSGHTATDTDFGSGYIYVGGYDSEGTVFQAYDPDNDMMIDLASSPNVSNHSTITVMRF